MLQTLHVTSLTQLEGLERHFSSHVTLHILQVFRDFFHDFSGELIQKTVQTFHSNFSNIGPILTIHLCFFGPVNVPSNSICAMAQLQGVQPTASSTISENTEGTTRAVYARQEPWGLAVGKKNPLIISISP